MVTYDELCKTFLKEVPRREAIDQMLRELPAKMAQAISESLGAPNGTVGLCRRVIDQMGHQMWEACENDCLQTDQDGIYEFGVSLRTGFQAVAPGASTYHVSLKYSIMYFQFSIEEFDESSVELRIKNLDGSIPIDNVHDPASYAGAAKLAIERLMDNLKNPKPMRGSRAPIGFSH